MSTRLPPYGRSLSQRLAAGKRPPIIFVCAGLEAWDLARDEVADDRRLVLPPDEDPASFDWSLVRGHDCLIIERGSKRDLLDRLAAVLLRAGAPLVLLHTEFATPLEYLSSYRPVARAAA